MTNGPVAAIIIIPISQVMLSLKYQSCPWNPYLLAPKPVGWIHMQYGCLSKLCHWKNTKAFGRWAVHTWSYHHFFFLFLLRDNLYTPGCIISLRSTILTNTHSTVISPQIFMPTSQWMPPPTKRQPLHKLKSPNIALFIFEYHMNRTIQHMLEFLSFCSRSCLRCSSNYFLCQEKKSENEGDAGSTRAPTLNGT